MIKIKTFHFNPLETCCAVVHDDAEKACAIIDPGCCSPGETDGLLGFLEAEGLVPEKILLTHGHFDHSFGAAAIAVRLGIKVLMHPADRKVLEKGELFSGVFGMDGYNGRFPTEDIADGDLVKIGNNLEFKVIHVPGHTPGSVCFLHMESKTMFGGDTLFAGSIGRTDLPGGDYDALMESIFGKLLTLDPAIMVIPGHGPDTTIGREALYNPFLEPFNEPEETE